MAIEFTFRITQDEIQVRDRETGFDRTFANRVAVDEKRGIIVALGESEEAAKTRLGTWYLNHASEVRFCSLFSSSGADLRFEIRLLEYVTRMLHHQSQDTRRFRHLRAKLVNGFDYAFEIPGYEAFPEDRRHALEESIQAHMRLRRLVVNGTEVQIPVRRREAEFWLRRLLVWIVPVVATAIAYVAAPMSIRENRLVLFVYLLAIAFAIYYGGRVLWMIAARRLVPTTYRLCMLQGVRYRVPAIDQWLARVLWGEQKV